MAKTHKSALKKAVAENLRSFRLKAGLTQQEVADRACYHVTYYARLENDPQNISLEGLEKLASALNRSIVELVSTEKSSSISDTKKLFSEALNILKSVENRLT